MGKTITDLNIGGVDATRLADAAASKAIADAQSKNTDTPTKSGATSSEGSTSSPTQEYNINSEQAQTTAKQFAMIGTASDLSVVGSSLYPMIYLFFFGDKENQGLISHDEEQCIVENLKKWSDNSAGHTSSSGTTSGANLYSTYYSDASRCSTNKAKQYAKMFKSAVKNNPNYTWMVCNACTNLMAKYKGRIPVSGGAYYQNSAKTQTSYWPVLDPNDPNVLESCMQLLSLLLKNGLIEYDFDLGIRPLDIQSGTLHSKEQYSASLMERMRNCGKPIKGQFTVNPKSTTPQFYHTFSGIDITAVAAVGNVVTRLEGLSQISWSVHSGKTNQKPLGKTGGGARTSGTRTIAGTLVFTLFDHHPLLDLLPADLTKYTANSATSGKQRLYRPRYMPDQIPPFDLTIILTNEYGYASVVTLYGIQVPDEGTVLGIDNLVTETVCQYTAVSMDPIIQVTPDDSGNIDPYGIVSGGWSDLWRQREIVIQGVDYSNLEDAYESFYDSEGES